MRLVIIGNSGAGKSHHARAVSAEHHLEHLDLDTLVWEPDQIAVQRPLDDARADLDDFARTHDAWVVEGCYGDLVNVLDDGRTELRWLDPGVEVCIEHCRARPWEPHKYASREEQDARLPMLLEWVRGYETRTDAWSRAGHAAVHDAWSGPKIVMGGPRVG